MTPAELAELSDKELRLLIAHCAGILAGRSDCYDAATILRRVADALLRPAKTA